MASSILVAIFSDVVWIRVQEKGSFKNSPELRQFARQMMDNGTKRIVVDLEDCPSMDSTFMGTLTGIAIRIQSRFKDQGKLQVVNLSDRNRRSLCELGLDHVMDLDHGEAWREECDFVHRNIDLMLDKAEFDVDHQKQVIEEAHVALCQANTENVPRFQDVLEFLRRPCTP